MSHPRKSCVSYYGIMDCNKPCMATNPLTAGAQCQHDTLIRIVRSPQNQGGIEIGANGKAKS
jgi:hypothetical protein